jgi:YD repeat-containing protein
MALAVDRGTNQLNGAGYDYDVLGNLVNMPAGDGVGTVGMVYLDQGHIGTLTDAAGVVWKYYYDADGKRRRSLSWGAPEARPDISPACRGARPGLTGRPRPPDSRPPSGGRAPVVAHGNECSVSVNPQKP